MAAVSVTIGAENKTKAGLDAAKSDVRKWKADVDKIANGRGGGGVVLEGDNKVKRSMANITSGLLQANDAGEALIGTLGHVENAFRSSLAGGVAAVGVIAVASAVYDAQQKFDQLITKVGEFRKSLSEVANFGTGEENLGQFGAIRKSMDELEAKAKEIGTLKNQFLTLGGSAFGGDTTTEKMVELNVEILKLQNAQGDAYRRVVQMEEDALRVAKLRGEGRDEEAIKAENQIKLEAELLKIDRLRLSEGAERLKNLKLEQFQAAENRKEIDRFTKVFEEADAVNTLEREAKIREEEKFTKVFEEADAVNTLEREAGYNLVDDAEKAAAAFTKVFEAQDAIETEIRENRIDAELRAEAKAKEVADVADQRAQNRAVKNEQERFEAEQEATSKIGMTGAQAQALRKSERTLDIGDRRRAAREVEKIDRESRKMGKGALTQEQRANLGAEIVGKLKDQRDGTAEAKHLAAIEKIMKKIDGVIERK